MKQHILEGRLNLLAETAKHFNSKNRGFNKTRQQCVYTHGCNGGCAIGRKVDAKLARKLQRVSKLNTEITNYDIFDLLPDSLKQLGMKFLSVVQGLHDDEDNWDETGLSKLGISEYKRILRTYCR